MGESRGEWTVDFRDVSEMWLRTAEALRLSLARTETPMPSLSDYKNNSFIFSNDLSKDFSSCNSKWITPTSDGTFSLSLNFAKPLPQQTVALLIFETVSTIKIGVNGDVSMD